MTAKRNDRRAAANDPRIFLMCLILTIVFLLLSVQAFMQNDWSFALLYSAIAIFFIWLLQNNVKAILKHKGRCGPSGCSFFDLFRSKSRKQ